MLADCGAVLGLVGESGIEAARAALEGDSLELVATEPLGAAAELSPSSFPPPDSLAYLQYTSGSTGAPRGVMISHANLFANARDISVCLPSDASSLMVSWLPLFHDMGLVFGAMYPIFAGFPCHLMDPASFLQEPMRWLRAISRVGASHSGAPNFAYGLCAERVNPDALASLSLSSWLLAMCGAEPIHGPTLARFARVFAPAGFRAEAFAVGYGLAEATLMVTVASGGIRTSASPGQGAREAVDCGAPAPGSEARIAHPETRAPCAEGEIGEVLVRGPGVGAGYWNAADTTAATFGARLRGEEASYLATGDLGFLRAGRLHVTGRIKDLIIVRGGNHYPQDIERTLDASHPAIKPHASIAFTIERDGREALGVACELRRTAARSPDAETIFQSIRAQIALEHGVAPEAIVLLRPGRLPVTSSGKPQRRECRRLFLAGELDPLAEWRESDAPAEQVSDGAKTSRADLENWLRRRCSAQLGAPADEIDLERPLAAYGFDSLAAARIAADLGRLLGRPVSPTLAYDYPTIASLAEHLAGSPAPKGAEKPRALPDETTVAIVGMACRFPGAPSLAAFRELVFEGRDAVGELPPGRWDENAFARIAALEEPARGVALTRGGWLPDVAGFDERFFGMSAREAERADPQQRLLLEVAWDALEDAGVPPNRLAGKPVGVYVGISDCEYRRLGAGLAALDPHSGTGSAR